MRIPLPNQRPGIRFEQFEPSPAKATPRRQDALRHPSPNPGVDLAFRFGVPVLVLDRRGGTHVAHTRADYDHIRKEAS